jgi:hypothetical protein
MKSILISIAIRLDLLTSTAETGKMGERYDYMDDFNCGLAKAGKSGYGFVTEQVNS